MDNNAQKEQIVVSVKDLGSFQVVPGTKLGELCAAIDKEW